MNTHLLKHKHEKQLKLINYIIECEGQIRYTHWWIKNKPTDLKHLGMYELNAPGMKRLLKRRKRLLETLTKAYYKL